MLLDLVFNSLAKAVLDWFCGLTSDMEGCVCATGMLFTLGTLTLSTRKVPRPSLPL